MSFSENKYKYLVLSPYPIEGASARYRLYAFRKILSEKGIELIVRPFLSPTTFKLRSDKGNRNLEVLMGISYGFIRRFIHTSMAKFAYDGIYIHRQAFPLLHRQFDQFIIKSGLPIIFDMDDAVFTEYPIDHILKVASAVTVGNEYLASYVRKVAPHVQVTIIPTTVDINKYQPLKREGNKTSEPIVGWIGTSSTFKRYLLPVLADLVDVTRKYGGQFRVIASLDVKEIAEEVGAVFIPWTLDTEIPQLQQFDIGVMPLHDDEYVRGKCAFKLIQYGALGIPGIGTNIGANREVVKDGISGFLSENPQDMMDKLEFLLKSPELRLKMGKEARNIITDNYSMQSQAYKLEEIFKTVLEGKGV